MGRSLKQIEISNVDCCLRIRNINAADPNAYEAYALVNIKGVKGLYEPGIGVRDPSTNQKANPYPEFDDMLRIQIEFLGDDPPIDFDIQYVDNQPGWTADLAGLQQAVADICQWHSDCTAGSLGGGGALATEATLQAVLSAIQDGQDFEAKIVVDDNGNGTTYLEVRIWNPDTQTWETPLYYLPGSNVGVGAGALTAPIIYQNPNTLLAQIVSNTTPGVRTHNYLRAVAVGFVPAGSYGGSVLNAGAANGTWNGSIIAPGEAIPWGDVSRDTYNQINYDATGTTLVIEYTT